MKIEDEYAHQLVSCRKEALDALIKEYPGIPEIFGRMTAFFTDFIWAMDGVEVGDEKLQYKLLLTVSFMRTHVCVCEHIFNSENIEAATLMRKQLELIARLREVEVKDLETLYDKVPNVAFGQPMNVLYGILSKIAHNTNLDSLNILGYRMDDERHKHVYVYPVYNENTIYSFDVAVGLFFMFGMETVHLRRSIFQDYDVQNDGQSLVGLLKFGKSTNIPFFKWIDINEFHR